MPALKELEEKEEPANNKRSIESWKQPPSEVYPTMIPGFERFAIL